MKKFKVLFVYPNFGTPYSFHPGIQILSAILKSKGFDTALLHLHEKYGIPHNIKIIIDEVKKHSPDLIGFTSTSFEFEIANEIAGDIKKYFPDVPVILGGIHATTVRESLVESNFDAYCIGEAELSLVELVRKMSERKNYYDTPSFHFKTKNGIIKNPIGEIVDNLDELPFYDMEIMDTKKLLEVRANWLSVGFSRGCPYDCTFCINTLLKRIMKESQGNLKNYLRKRSVESVILEFESIIQKYRNYIKVFNFDDDLLMLYKDWMMKFTQEYKERIFDKFGIQYAINARANTLDDELVAKMAKSGCREIRIGFETGNFKLRKEILNKPVTDEELKKAFNLCNKYGINSNAFAMIGIPGETHQTIRETIEMILELKPELIRMTFLYPYYNTAIYDYCKQRNLFKGKKHRDVFSDSPLKFEDLSDVELLKYKVLFPWYLSREIAGKYKKKYAQLIDEFRDTSYEEFRKQETFEKIIKLDYEMSEKLTKENIPHYCYFQKNLYYFQKKCY
ncbi:MAG: radical SAM protein [Elusimicrobiota bacterium]|nr:radical SAM protein [Elusimicrobiota bacterium]